MSCPDCFRGSARDGKPAGTEEIVCDILTYVATPLSGTTSTSCVIFITDAFGFNLVNSKLLADEYAAQTGCRVLVPDIIPGGGVPVDSLELMNRVSSPVGTFDLLGQAARAFDVVRMMARFLPFALRTRSIFPTVLAYARAIRSELPADAKLGAAGFCWGALQTTKLSAEPSVEGGDKPLLDAHFTAHPSGLKIPVDFVDATNKFHVPISVAVGEKDTILPKSSAEELEISLKQEFGQDQSRCELIIYEECGHGFAVRADPRKTVENEAAKKAARQAVEWFKRFLS